MERKAVPSGSDAGPLAELAALREQLAALEGQVAAYRQAKEVATALAAFGAQPVDLVCTDLGMPGMTGWELAQALKARAPSLPVVLLTGWGDQAAAQADKQGLVDRILGKPARLQELLAAIAELTGDQP